MSFIIPFLYLGSGQDAQNQTFITGHKIQLIVNCAKEVPNYLQNVPGFNNVNYMNLNLDDVPQQNIIPVLEPTASKIISFIKGRKNVLVHCAAGISRSSSVVIYTIMKLYKWPFDKAYNYVKDLHPNTNPNPGFKGQLERLSLNPNIEWIEPNTHQNSYGTVVAQGEGPKGEGSKGDGPKGEGPKGDGPKGEGPKGWSNLTLEGEDGDKPTYLPHGKYRQYANIFS